MGGKRITLEVFIERSNLIHGFKYDYSCSVYVSSRSSIKIKCKKHGIFEQRASAHMIDGQGCPSCRRKRASETKIKKTSKTILDKFRNIHGDKYEYERFKYMGDRVESVITCRTHGDFMQTPNAHNAGKGCLACSKESQLYRRSNYVNKCIEKYNSKSNFYILKIFDIDGSCFYKIGITVQEIKSRFPKSKMPYDFKVAKLIKSDAEKIFNAELKIKSILSDFRYQPKIKFGGSRYECFSQITESAMMVINELELNSVKISREA